MSGYICVHVFSLCICLHVCVQFPVYVCLCCLSFKRTSENFLLLILHTFMVLGGIASQQEAVTTRGRGLGTCGAAARGAS